MNIKLNVLITKLKILIPMALILLGIDNLYLKSVSCYFKRQIFKVQQTPMKINYPGAIICYFLLCAGLYYFIISQRKPVYEAFILGIVIYGIFETTNKAIFTRWTWKTVLLDSVWGGILYALTTFATYKLLF